MNEEKKDIICITDKKEGKMDRIHIFMDEYEDKDKDKDKDNDKDEDKDKDKRRN